MRIASLSDGMSSDNTGLSLHQPLERSLGNGWEQLWGLCCGVLFLVTRFRLKLTVDLSRRRNAAVTIKLNQAEFAALERAAGNEDLGPFCRQIITNHLKNAGEHMPWFQLRQQLALREILKRSLLLVPGVDAKEVERIESDVSRSEDLLVQEAIFRFKRELEEAERQSVRTALLVSTPDDGDEDTSKANEAKCLSIVKKLVNLAIKNPGELVGLQRDPHGRWMTTLRAGKYHSVIELPDDPSYKTWCFFVDDFYKALNGDPQFNWYLREK